MRRVFNKNIKGIYNEAKLTNIKKANVIDEEFEREYETMTDSEKALKDAVDLIFY